MVRPRSQHFLPRAALARALQARASVASPWHPDCVADPVTILPGSKE
jgi:hypothetical protein